MRQYQPKHQTSPNSADRPSHPVARAGSPAVASRPPPPPGPPSRSCQAASREETATSLTGYGNFSDFHMISRELEPISRVMFLISQDLSSPSSIPSFSNERTCSLPWWVSISCVRSVRPSARWKEGMEEAGERREEGAMMAVDDSYPMQRGLRNFTEISGKGCF